MAVGGGGGGGGDAVASAGLLQRQGGWEALISRKRAQDSPRCRPLQRVCRRGSPGADPRTMRRLGDARLLAFRESGSMHGVRATSAGSNIPCVHCVCMHACHHSRIHTNINTAGNRDGLNLPLAWCALGHAYGRRYAACTRRLPQHSGVAPSGPPSAQQQHKHDSGLQAHLRAPPGRRLHRCSREVDRQQDTCMAGGVQSTGC